MSAVINSVVASAGVALRVHDAYSAASQWWCALAGGAMALALVWAFDRHPGWRFSHWEASDAAHAHDGQPRA